jgi:hypothetical protein
MAWDADCPRFHVTELDERGDPVRRHFNKPYVYYVGSHEGCGCGFQYGEYEGFEEESDLVQKQESRRLLTGFLANALQHQTAVELFACWDGDERHEPEHRGRVRPMDLLRSRTYFRERELLIVSETTDV